MKHLLLTTIAAVLLVGCYPLFIAADAVIAPQNFSIHKAARVGHIKAVKRNLASGTNVNAKDEDGVTPLLVATANGRKEIVELLIREGADVNAKDRMGWTPLCEAVINGHKEIVELLIANGADVNAKDDRGMSPLNWAIKQILQTSHSPAALQQKYKEIRDLLRKHGGKTGEELKAEGK